MTLVFVLSSFQISESYLTLRQKRKKKVKTLYIKLCVESLEITSIIVWSLKVEQGEKKIITTLERTTNYAALHLKVNFDQF